MSQELNKDKEILRDLILQNPYLEFIRFAEEINKTDISEKTSDIYRLIGNPFSSISDQASGEELAEWLSECLNTAQIGGKFYIKISTAPWAEVQVSHNGNWLFSFWGDRPRRTLLLSSDKTRFLEIFMSEYTHDAYFKKLE